MFPCWPSTKIVQAVMIRLKHGIQWCVCVSGRGGGGGEAYFPYIYTENF